MKPADNFTRCNIRIVVTWRQRLAFALSALFRGYVVWGAYYGEIKALYKQVRKDMGYE
jgi:hypothetical protein